MKAGRCHSLSCCQFRLRSSGHSWDCSCAILIVEFAKIEHEKGRDLVEAAVAGAKLRLRPILMTSFAFILGCVPLWIASGSGAAGRRILGTVVITGMLAATCIAIFIIPMLFVVVERIAARLRRRPHAIITDREPSLTGAD